jgi:large subunit ribosomal protein L17
MRHRIKGRKFGRKRGKKRAFLRTLIGNLIMSERIITTEARAKEIRGKIEKLITLAKRQGSIATYRTLISRIPKPAALKINQELKQRYLNRQGGYTRIIKTESKRMRDGSKTVLIELIK